MGEAIDLERLNWVTERVIGCAFEVSNGLECGFLEKPYENAMKHLLVKAGLRVEPQWPIKIWFDGVVVGNQLLGKMQNDKTIDLGG